jgi:hypothetical protein
MYGYLPIVTILKACQREKKLHYKTNRDRGRRQIYKLREIVKNLIEDGLYGDNIKEGLA